MNWELLISKCKLLTTKLRALHLHLTSNSFKPVPAWDFFGKKKNHLETSEKISLWHIAPLIKICIFLNLIQTISTKHLELHWIASNICWHYCQSKSFLNNQKSHHQFEIPSATHMLPSETKLMQISLEELLISPLTLQYYPIIKSLTDNCIDHIHVLMRQRNGECLFLLFFQELVIWNILESEIFNFIPHFIHYFSRSLPKFSFHCTSW